MGGKDVVHIKQLKSSDLRPNEVQKLLQQVTDERFSEDLDRCYNGNSSEISGRQEVHRIKFIILILNFLYQGLGYTCHFICRNMEKDAILAISFLALENQHTNTRK